MKNSILDRFFCILFYWTAGFFGIIYLIFAYMRKKPISSFITFNIYQSLFFSVLLYVLSLVYGIFVNLIGVIPIIGKFVVLFDGLVFRAPVVLGCTVAGCFLLLFSFYVAIFCLLNKKPYIPFVSQIVEQNFGG